MSEETRIEFRVTKSVGRRWRVIAAQRGVSLSALIREAMHAYLSPKGWPTESPLSDE